MVSTHLKNTLVKLDHFPRDPGCSHRFASNLQSYNPNCITQHTQKKKNNSIKVAISHPFSTKFIQNAVILMCFFSYFKLHSQDLYSRLWFLPCSSCRKHPGIGTQRTSGRFVMAEKGLGNLRNKSAGKGWRKKQ